MSWIEKLYNTYENSTSCIGDCNDLTQLLPICHTTQNAQVHIVIDEGGRFLRASVIPKSEARTIIPATEESAGRTSGPVPHPLCDKLQYVAGDYAKYGGTRPPLFDQYCRNLADWSSSIYARPKLRSVLSYVQKGRLIEDLVAAMVLRVDDSGVLLDKWPGNSNETPEIFRVIQGQGGQSDSFVRFSVDIPGEEQAAVWTDRELWQSWVDYYGGMKSVEGLCYVTGKRQLMADQHPAKIRSGGDKAKLISSNDKNGYTFRGRFFSADEACGVGFEATQKAHNALRWLIKRQGYQDGDQAIVAWAVSGAAVPDPFADTLSFVLGENSEEIQKDGGYTASELGIQLSMRIAGYAAKLSETTDVVVMGLDSATPGRMSIRFYRELTGSELLARVRAWHEGCCWLQRFGKGRVFVGAPAPSDIAVAAYGKRVDDKLRKATVERLLPCIVDGSPLPRDLVESCVRRASSRQGIETWEWEKALGIACALYRYQNQERSYSMSLDRERTTRDYLYGRLLALAEHLEGRALYVGGEKRETNAAKLMQRFAERPYSTWLIIETGLAPYKTRLRAKRSAFLYNTEKEIDEVVSSFSTDDFIGDHRLTGEFLLGYHCQRVALHPESIQNADDSDDSIETQANQTTSQQGADE